jgi:predicted lipoprotein with Yx(FWY)xxD motif
VFAQEIAMTIVRPALLAAAIVFAAGCNRGAPVDSSQPATGVAATTQATPPPDTTPPAGMETTAPPPATGEPNPPATSGADLDLAESAEHGRYLVDATGKALYMLEKDSKGTSTCHDACATQWPPLLAQQGVPGTRDPSLDKGAVGVIQRNDGTQQVTFNGHPLYHYAKDTATGQINGAGREDQFGEWYLLGPDGNPVQGH